MYIWSYYEEGFTNLFNFDGCCSGGLIVYSFVSNPIPLWEFGGLPNWTWLTHSQYFFVHLMLIGNSFSSLYSHGCGCHCSTLVFKFPLCIFFNAGSVVMNSFVCTCVEMFFCSLWIVKVKFDFGGRNLYWQLFPLGVWNTFSHAFLDFKFSADFFFCLCELSILPWSF